MLEKKYIAAAILMFASFSSGLHAQDIFSTTGETVRSYNYVEGLYLVNLQDDLPDGAEVDLPVLFRLSVDLLDNVSVSGEYANQSYDITAPNGETGDFKLLFYELGLRYRSELKQLQNTDWIAGITYRIVDFEVNAPDAVITSTTNFYGVYLGGRRTLTNRLEFEIGIDYSRPKAGGNFTGYGEATLVYRVANRLDIALAATDITDSNNYGFGLRYTWD